MQCPYNADHRVDAKLYNSHVPKCRIGYSGPLIQCQFNPRHWIPMPEVGFHSRMCADRQLYLTIEATLQCEPIPLQRESELADNEDSDDGAEAADQPMANSSAEELPKSD